ncbi:MAG: ATP-binding protein [Fretibacterium sp.]|nr:ATP-binding protein [Fretibacterium sp.]
MYREIVKKLRHWKDSAERKPLLLTGVRQCGKTYTARSFGAEYFEDVAYFNFEGNARLSSIFEYDYDTDRIVNELGNIIRGKPILPGRSLVIFDEVQECPRALSSLKYFCENKRGLHLLCAGSLLGVALKHGGISFPVGKVDRIEMFPMNFSEFVRADGGENILKGLEEIPIERELPALYTMPMEKYFKYYLLVGGMPEAVSQWVNSHNFARVEEYQDAILKDYESDLSKHAPTEQISRLHLIWRSVPKQMAKENNKFVFSHVKTGARAKDLGDSLQWIVDAGLVHRLEMVSAPEVPLSFAADASYFKIYMSDVGLLRKTANVPVQTVLEGGDGFARFKGALAENFVMNELRAQGMTPYFWRSGNSAELDFLIEQGGEVIPIEVKSADNTRAKSFHQFVSRYHPRTGFKVSLKNVGDNRDGDTLVWSLPLYMLWKLKTYIGRVSPD